MSAPTTVELKVHLATGPKGRRELRLGAPPPPPPPEPRVPRLTRLMALAIRIEGLVRAGKLKDYAEAARFGRVTRARMSQIIGLLNLAPDIVESILFLPGTTEGPDPVLERDIRPIAAEADWAVQRQRWRQLVH